MENDFSAVATQPYGAMQTMKIKACEGPDCGKNFVCLAISPVRDCQECRQRAEQRRKELASIPPETSEDLEPFSPRESRLKYLRAAVALSMKESA